MSKQTSIDTSYNIANVLYYKEGSTLIINTLSSRQWWGSTVILELLQTILKMVL